MTATRRDFAVVIGINAYCPENGIKPLGTAVNDAQAIAALLRDEYEYSQIWELFDEQATYENILTLLRKTLPQQMGKGDRLLFYFAGHGITRKGKDGSPAGYLIPQDAKINLQTAEQDQSENFLPMQDLYDAFKAIDCHHLLVILDCCYAGMFRWATRKLISYPEHIHQEHYDRFIRFPAWQVLASAAHDQEALDLVTDQRGVVPGKGHSPFAMALLQGLGHTGGKLNADFTGDGVITTPELYLYVDQFVNEDTRERQTPGFWSLRSEFDRGEFIFTKPGFDPKKNLTPAPPLDASNNPYRGLESFEERHARFFFGRKALIEDLYERLSQPTRSLTIVLGASGSGKSSLVKAGLIPYLRERQKKDEQSQPWQILDPMRPGDSPFTALARILLPIAHPNLIQQLEQLQGLNAIFRPQEKPGTKGDRTQQSQPTKPGAEPNNTFTQLFTAWSDATSEAKLLLVVDYFEELQKHYSAEALVELGASIKGTIEQLARSLQGDRYYLSQIITIWSQTQPNTKLLLVIDQFEELITRAQEHQSNLQTDKEWQSFLTMLRVALASHRHRLHIVLTLRSDFEPRFLGSPLKAHWRRGRFPVRAMTSDELRQAIEGPALKQALYFEPPDLVGKLIDEVGQMPGALPLLSFTLSELYINLVQRWQEPNSTERALKLEDYTKLGGVAGSLTRRATEEYEQIGKDKTLSEAGQRTMQRVMLRMVTIEGGGVARRRVPESELLYPTNDENRRARLVIDRLVEARLFVKGQETGDPYVEPAHDFLVRGWDKLQKWIKENQEDIALQSRLTPAANDWRDRKGGLWSREKDRLVQLEKIFTSSAGNWLNELEVVFFQKSKERRIFELKEAEKQRDEAIVGQIRALNSLADVQLRTNDHLGSLATSIKAGKKLIHASPSVKDNTSRQTVSTLKNILANIQEYNRFQGHSGTVWDIAFHPSCELIASASYDKTIRFWHFDGNLINTFKEHESDVVSICFNHSGSMLASAGYDGTVRLLHFSNVVTLEKVVVLRGHVDKVTSVCFSSDDKFVASVGLDKTVIFWNTDGSLLKSFKVGSRIWGIKFNPDKQSIALACADCTIQFFSLNGRRIKTFKGHTDAVTDISFSPDGRLLASAGMDKTIKLWSLDGKLLKTLEGHQNSIWRVEFSSDSKLLASSGWDNVVRIWSREGLLLTTLEGHTNRVWSARFLPRGQGLASCSADNTIKLWKVDTCLTKVFEGHKDWVWSIGFNPVNHFLASVSTDTTVRIWNYDGTLHQTLEGHKDLVSGVYFTNDGQMLASASADTTIKLWKLDKGEFKLFKTLGEHSARVRGLAFSPDGVLASASFDHTIKLWNQNGVLLDSLDGRKGGHVAEVISVCFSPDGKLLASGSYDCTVKIWNRNGQLRFTLNQHIDHVVAVAFSPDSQLLVSASDDKTLVLWKIEEEQITHFRTLKGHEGWVLGASFSQDGKLIASAGSDNTIKLWDVQTGYLLKTLKGHTDWVLGLGFEPNEGLLVSASADRTIKWWNLRKIDPASDFESLLSYGCDWIRNYLATNPLLADDERALCAQVPVEL